MTLLISRGYNGVSDPDAAAYVAAVEAADGQLLENAVGKAINAFVIGCKNDGIWTALKASCILAGARTLSGALVPLVGTAPTNVNFVSGDYNRKTGLGNANNSTKYINSNRASNADPQNSKHTAIYRTDVASFTDRTLVGHFTSGGDESYIDHRSTLSQWRLAINTGGGTAVSSESSASSGFIGASRSSGSIINFRINAASSGGSSSSVSPSSLKAFVFARNNNGTSVDNYFQGNLAFYSIGESLDLARLDSRVTDLINAFAAAIP